MPLAKRILLWFAVWTLIGLFFSTQLAMIFATLYRVKIDWTQAVLGTLPDWWLWFLLTPVLLWLARRFRFERAMWWPALAVHFLAGGVIAAGLVLGYAWIGYSLGWNIGPYKTLEERIAFVFAVKFHWWLVTYSVVIAVTQAADYYKKYQEREARLAQAQLQALRSQLHPHFLFNALHATMALIRKDPAAAEKMIVRLSDLLRATLDAGNAHEVPLRQEIHFLEQYLEIERTRFADRLAINLDIDPKALDVPVPHMILQPLVENAVKHGIAPRSAPGSIWVRAARDNGCLRMEVTDDGVGLAKGAVKEGIGLSNTRARLRQLYGDGQKMELVAPPGGGFSARLEIPARL
jgi:signal transduction histidine kinase